MERMKGGKRRPCERRRVYACALRVCVGRIARSKVPLVWLVHGSGNGWCRQFCVRAAQLSFVAETVCSAYIRPTISRTNILPPPPPISNISSDFYLYIQHQFQSRSLRFCPPPLSVPSLFVAFALHFGCCLHIGPSPNDATITKYSLTRSNKKRTFFRSIAPAPPTEFNRQNSNKILEFRLQLRATQLNKQRRVIGQAGRRFLSVFLTLRGRSWIFVKAE